MAHLRILAVADTHVDDRIALAGMNPADPETGEPLVLAQARRDLAWVAEVARAERVDLILHAGDVYERPRPSPASEAVAANAFDAWCDVAPVIVITGNHDTPQGSDAHALEPLRYRRPGRLHVVDRPAPLAVLRGLHGPRITILDPSDERADGPHRLATVYPIPYPRRAYLAGLVDGVEETNGAISAALDRVMLAHAAAARAARANGTAAVMLGHGTLRGASYSAYQTVPLTDVQIGTEHFDAFDLHVWGHLHQRQDAPGWAGRFGAFVGGLNRHDFGEEGEAKGVYICDVSTGGGSTHVERAFIENPHARIFQTLTAEAFEASMLGDPTFEPVRGAIAASVVWRIVGEVDEARSEAINARVRGLKAAGVLIKNETEVARVERTRVAIERPDLGIFGAVAAACNSRPDLAPNADAITSRVAELRAARLEKVSA